MIKKPTNESGFATIIVLMLTVALFILVGFALKTVYSVYRQNRKDKQQIIQKVEQLNQKNSIFQSKSPSGLPK